MRSTQAWGVQQGMPLGANAVKKGPRMQPTSHVNVKYENGSYYVRDRSVTFDKDGLKLSSLTEDEAIAEYLSLKKKYLENKNYQGPNTLFIQIYEPYLTYQQDRMKAGKLKPKSFQEKKWILTKHLLPHFSNFKPKDITKSAWLKFTDKTSTVKDFTNLRKVLTNVLIWARDPENGGYVTFIPEFELPEYEAREGKVLEQEEIELIHRSINNPDLKDIWKLISLTGCRKMEIQGLGWDRVDFNRGLILTKEGRSRTKTPRWIPVSQEALSIVRSRQGNHDTWVFPDKNNPYRFYHDSHFKNQLAVAVARAGLSNICFKDLRTTFANRIQELGVSADDATKYLGHSKEVFEGHYNKQQENARKRVVDALDDNKPGLRVVK